jgi:hypothetical protein
MLALDSFILRPRRTSLLASLLNPIDPLVWVESEITRGDARLPVAILLSRLWSFLLAPLTLFGRSPGTSVAFFQSHPLLRLRVAVVVVHRLEKLRVIALEQQPPQSLRDVRSQVVGKQMIQ